MEARKTRILRHEWASASLHESPDGPAHHLTIEDVPGFIKGVVYVLRRRRAYWQGHLEHNRIHAGGATVLNDEKVKEPPGLGEFVLGTVNDCIH